MARPRTPYEDTSVSVERSQAAIRRMLRDAGAEGVSFGEEWKPPKMFVRFLWRMEGAGLQQRVRLEVTPLEPDGRKGSVEQRERQAWRGLAHYLEGTLKAATFGLVRFEDVFLSFMELPDERTLGDVLIPQLLEGRLALPAGDE